MADVKSKTVSITVDQVELDALRNGLELARRSLERRVSSESGDIAALYQNRLAVVLALATKLPVKVPA